MGGGKRGRDECGTEGLTWEVGREEGMSGTVGLTWEVGREKG